MKRFIYLWLPFILCLAGCDSEDEYKGPVDNDFPVDRYVNAYLVNEAGEDLLDASVSGYIDPGGIRIYSVVDGKEVLYQNEHAVEATYGVSPAYSTEDGRQYVHLGLVYYPQNGESVEIVKWTDTWADTIRCKLNSIDNIDQVYVNGVLKYDGASAAGLRDIVFTRPSESEGIPIELSAAEEGISKQQMNFATSLFAALVQSQDEENLPSIARWGCCRTARWARRRRKSCGQCRCRIIRKTK